MVSPTVSALIPSLLRESADPESCITLLERLITTYPKEVLREFDRHPAFFHYAILTFGHSRFLSETLMQNSDLLSALLRKPGLDRSDSAEEIHQRLARFLARSSRTDLSSPLARFKRREYFRIMLRDVLKIAPLAETTAEISTLSDVLIETALREAGRRLHKKFGLPQHEDAHGRLAATPFAVLAVGKLGGSELNYCSDVDLIYVYGDGQDADGSVLGGREYFVRLAQELTGILSQITPEGPVFRLDLRLRPQGNEGELAISTSQALRYYSSGAADWELQALTKVRFAAGDAALARDFIRAVQPLVYTAQANFLAIQTAQESREKMSVRRLPAQAALRTTDVKLDRGGIREIEFLVQCLQRVYGGAEPWLRSAGTMSCLQKLCDKNHLSSTEFSELSSAYEFLRHVEHRLQLRYGQQTHQLPESHAEREILQRTMKPYLGPAADTENFQLLIERKMASVAETCEKIIARQQVLPKDTIGFELSSPQPRGWSASQEEILKRLSRDAPAIHEIATSSDLSSYGRKNLFLFLNSAMSSSDCYGTLVREAFGMARAMPIFESSEFLTEALIRHPEQIAIVAGLETVPRGSVAGYLFENADLLISNPQDPVFTYVATSKLSYGEKLAMLRRHFWHKNLISGARDVLEGRRVYDSLADTSCAAEEAIRTAYAIAGAPPNFSVMALGRLGSGEFDVLSDADLIFVSDSPDASSLRKTAEQMVHILSAYTRDGFVFPVDTRLRPRGSEGEILLSPAQWKAYCEEEAHPWEALGYSKMRFVAGSRLLTEQVVQATQCLFDRCAQAPDFSDAVLDMRKRLETSDPAGFKTRSGGIYDIDFLASYLMIRHSIPNKNGTLRDRLWRLASTGALEKPKAAVLDHAAEFLRTVEHATRLVTGRSLKVLPGTEHALQLTEKLTSASLREEFPEGLRQRYDCTSAQVREIFKREVSGNRS